MVSRATENQKLSVLSGTTRAQRPPSRKILLETNPCFLKHARWERDGDSAVRGKNMLFFECRICIVDIVFLLSQAVKVCGI